MAGRCGPMAALIAMALCTGTGSAQELQLPPVRYPELPAAADGVAGFVPAGWSIVANSRGDLNGDGTADLALVLKMNDRGNILAVPNGDESVAFDTNPHLLVVAFAERGGGYRLAASSRGLFPRPTAPFTGDVPPGPETIRTERGTLVVNYEYLRDWARYRFRWQAGAMQLIGYDSGGVAGGCIFTTSINFLTGRARLSRTFQETDRTRTATRRLTSAERPTLDRIDLETYSADLAVAGEPLLCNPEYE